MHLPHSTRTLTRTYNGFATLTSVLLAGSVGSAIAVTLLLSGVNSTRNSMTITQSTQARALRHACAQQALGVIHDSLGWTGQGSLTFNDGSCTYAVTAGTGERRTVFATGTVGNVMHKLTLEISNLTPKIITSSWKEVADF